eukprot:815756-Amphidinium_carterae.1
MSSAPGTETLQDRNLLLVEAVRMEWTYRHAAKASAMSWGISGRHVRGIFKRGAVLGQTCISNKGFSKEVAKKGRSFLTSIVTNAN